MTTEESEILHGNILLSKYLFGAPKITGYYQIGYKRQYPWMRAVSELYDDSFINFHNDWNVLMQVVANIAKDSTESFSKEEILMDEIASMMFEYAQSPIIAWASIISYVKLKLIV